MHIWKHTHKNVSLACPFFSPNLFSVAVIIPLEYGLAVVTCAPSFTNPLFVDRMDNCESQGDSEKNDDELENEKKQKDKMGWVVM